VPLFIGSKAMVEKAEEMMREFSPEFAKLIED
jgi:hypothetical protein